MSVIIAHWRRNFKSALSRSHLLQQHLAANAIEHHCRAVGHHWRESFWTPSMTLLTFLLQALNSVKSLRAAVAELLAHLAQQSQEHLPSGDPSAFAQARLRLPEAAITRVFDDVVKHVQTLARDDPRARWRGHRVIVIDGSNVSMPDTPALQKEFPQHSSQKPGCGFPQANLVALFEWRSGVVLDYRMGSQHDSEASLFRKMLEHFTADTLALADRYYCSYLDIARIQQRGGTVVFRLHKRRPHDFRKAARLDQDDGLITWRRPKWIPSFGISREELERLPEEITLRMVRTTDAPRGFRSREIVIVTTILDPAEAPRHELLALYRDRWLAELSLRSIKSTLGMEFLRGHTSDIVRKEVRVHLLLYNLLRLLMWEAARHRDRDPQRLSFAGTLHRLQSMACHMLFDARVWNEHHALLTWLLASVARDVVPDRPDRFEPRRIKRRPKNYSRLTKPRSHYLKHGDRTCR